MKWTKARIYFYEARVSMVHRPDKFDDKYLGLLLRKIEVCKAYRPKFGKKGAVSLGEFKTLYGDDMFYNWFGMNSPLLYAAHKAAGGITSLYRQIGIGCEWVVKQILRDRLSLSDAQIAWSYTKTVPGRKKPQMLTLDGRIPISEIRDAVIKKRIVRWMRGAMGHVSVVPEIAATLKGPVFEVRQGYKSKDSKRQNADIANAGTAYSQAWFPVAMLLSNQIDGDVAEAYVRAGWLLLRGVNSDSPYLSTYAFFQNVIGYDLAGFFHRNSAMLRAKVEEVLQALLVPETSSGGSRTRQKFPSSAEETA